MKAYTYYPGCSIKGTGKGYEESLLAVFNEFEMPLIELEDWNCCGATNFMNIDEITAFTLSARNLVLAKKEERDLSVPCSACFLNLKKAGDYIEKYPEIGQKVKHALHAGGLDYNGSPEIRHPLLIILEDIGEKGIKAKIKKSLRGLKAVPYYGCQIVRPYNEGFDTRYPDFFDEFLSYLGADVVDYPYKTRCCGGSLTGTLEEVGLRLNYLLLDEARKQGGDCIVTLCPLCHFNLECYQDKINKKYHSSLSVPVLYFSQILGIAMGIPASKLGLKRSLVNLKPMLSEA